MTLPTKWTNKTLRGLATINYGQDPSPILDDAGEYPVYGTSGSERQGTGYHYEGESVIVGRKGSIDRLHFAEGRFWTIDTAYFLSDFGDTVPKWLYYLLCNIDLRALNEATGVPSLSRDSLYTISTPTPPPDEQAKIAEVLSTVDRAIEQTEALIAKQQRIKTGLMQDLLTRGIDEHGDLRSERTHDFKDSPLGRIPVEWDVATVDQIASITTGDKDTQDADPSAKYPFFVRSRRWRKSLRIRLTAKPCSQRATASERAKYFTTSMVASTFTSASTASIPSQAPCLDTISSANFRRTSWCG